jgi:plastocyanin
MKRHARNFLAALNFSWVASFAFAAEHVVEIRDNMFKPEVLRIKSGDSVRWVNQEKRTTHSVLFKEPVSFESERFFPGESWPHRFEKPGRVVYSCGPHPEMKGVVEVE